MALLAAFGLVMLFALTPFVPTGPASPGIVEPAPTATAVVRSSAAAAAPPAAAAGSLVATGQAVAQRDGCVACHSVNGVAGVGPTWKGLAGSQVALDTGKSVLADDAYLSRSITDPDADVVKGYQKGVMASGVVGVKSDLTADNVAALVAYIKSLQ